MSYFDCALIPLRSDNLVAYRQFSEMVAKIYRENGALRVVDCCLDSSVGSDAEFHADGARKALNGHLMRDFTLAAAAEEFETVVLSWTEWPDKETRDLGLARTLSDPRIQPFDGQKPIFEGRRLVAGAFRTILDV